MNFIITMKLIKKIRNKLVNIFNDLTIWFLGKRWRIIFINEYPKCGGSWLKNMLGEILHEDGYFINKKKNHIPVIKPKYFFQRHWLKNTKYAFKTIIVLRDPRDAYNSFYFFENYHSPNPKKNKLFGYDESLEEKENIYRYLKNKLKNPEKSNPGFSYKDFYEHYKNENDICFVYYENLRQDTFNELKRILKYLGYSKDDHQIKQTIDNFDINNMKKKEKASDLRGKFVRKGVVGDWKNNFNEDSIKLVKSELGDILIEMGYESDKQW